MSLLTSSIDLDMIKSPAGDAIPQLNESDVEELAKLLLLSGDTVRPIILRRISPISFQILEGYFEYFAALKAQEIDDRFASIRAYVVPTELESTVLEQYNFLRSSSTSIPIPNLPPVTNVSLDLDKIEEAIANRLEQKLTAAVEKTIDDRINASLQVIVGQITKQLDAHLTDFRQSLSLVPVHQVLEAKTQPTQSIPEVVPEKAVEVVPEKTIKAVKVQTTSKSAPKVTAKPKTERAKTTAKVKDKNIDNNDPKVLQVLNELNNLNFAELQRKLSQSAKTNVKFARPIDEIRLQQPNQKFLSIQDVIINVQGLAEKTMQKIIDAW
jgi:ParB family chromosome partitioning protein